MAFLREKGLETRLLARHSGRSVGYTASNLTNVTDTLRYEQETNPFLRGLGNSKAVRFRVQSGILYYATPRLCHQPEKEEANRIVGNYRVS